MERGLYEQIADEELEAALEALVGRYQAQRLDEGDRYVSGRPRVPARLP